MSTVELTEQRAERGLGSPPQNAGGQQAPQNAGWKQGENSHARTWTAI